MINVFLNSAPYLVVFMCGWGFGVLITKARVFQNIHNFYIWLSEQHQFTPTYEETFRAAVGEWKPWEGKGTRR